VTDHTTPPAPDAAPASIPGAAPAPALSSVHGLGRVTVALLALAGVAWAARAVWEIRLAVTGEPASGPPDQGGGAHRPLTSLENAYHMVGTASAVTAVLCACLFLGWLGRVRDNGAALSGDRPRWPGLWLYAGWVVPVVNLWVPRTIVADAYRASAPGERLPRSLTVWWVLWLIGACSGAGFMYADSTDEVIARAYAHVWQLLASDAAVMGAAVAGILVVRAVTAAQERYVSGELRPGEAPVRPDAAVGRAAG
jgi:hypothetical protein